MKRIVSTLGVSLLVGILAASSASAVLLPQMVFTSLPGTTLGARPELQGLVLEDVVSPFSIATPDGSIFGTVQSRVVREDVSGTLDFYWRVIVDPNSAGSVGSFRLGQFYTGTYDADWRIDGAGSVSPQGAFLFSTPGFVNFEFGGVMGLPGNGLTPGAESYFMFLRTDATVYSDALMDLTNMGQTSISDAYSTFGPRYCVCPDGASTLLLAGLALSGLGALRRKLSV